MPVLYGTSIADTTVTTACTMTLNSGGTETSKLSTIPGTSNPYAEILSQGGTSTAVAALPSPTGHGWIFFPGAGTYSAGNWSASITKSSATKGVSSTLRSYKYSGGTYTAISTITATNTATVKTTYSFASTAMSSVTLTATEGIYFDLFHFDNNSNAGTDNPTIYVGNSATAGVVNDMQITLPTFTPASTQTSKDVVMRGLVSQQTAKDIVMRGNVSQLTSGRDVVMRGNVGVPPVPKDVVMRGNVKQGTSKDVTMRGNVKQLAGGKDIVMRGKPADTSVHDIVIRGKVAATILKDIKMLGNVGGTSRKDLTMRGNVSQLTTGKDLTMRGKISGPRIASGGFTLFANGTGTVSFASAFRATQYPDPALNLSPVLDRLGSSSVSWNSVTPAGTSAGMKTSTDGINFTTATNGAAIPGLNGQPDPVIDIFDGDSTATYTNTSKSGGSVATVTLDTANKRLTLAGGSGAVYLNSSIIDDDIDVIADLDESDAGGIVWRFVDNQNYYELGCYDDSASGGFTSQLRLYKVLAGTRTLLGSASAVTWYRNTLGTSPYKRIRVTMLAGIISVYFDGSLMQSYTDVSPLGAGKCGLRNDGGTSRYYQLRIQQQGDYVSGTPAGDLVTSKFVYTEQDLATTDPSTGPQVLDITTSARSPKIATGALIPQLHDPTLPFAEYFNKEMGTIAQTSGDYFWNVDKVGELMLNERNATPAPFCLHSTDLLFTPNIQPTNAADLYCNQVIVQNTIGLVTVSNEEKITDGTATSWNMAWPLYSAPEIVVGGVVKTVGVQGIDSNRDFYWQAGSTSIGQDDGADKLPAGYIMSFSYVGQYPDKVTRNNLAEQSARREVEGGSGIVCLIVDGKGMLSSNAIVYADGLLDRRKHNDTVEVVATTEKRIGLRSGMVVPMFLPEHHINNRQLLVTKVTRTGYMGDDGTTIYRDTITATDGPNLSNWADSLGL